MSELVPLISWETLINEVETTSTPYTYRCKVAYINPNDPGYGQLGADMFYMVDFAGRIFEIKQVVDEPTGYIEIYDLTEDPIFGPYPDMNAYVYQSRTGRAILTQAQRNRLDRTAIDLIWNTENNINQNVITNVDYIDFNLLDPNPSYKEGRLFYDGVRQTLSFYNSEADITVNLPEEFLIPVFNNTGTTISNGKLVYPTGVDVSTGIGLHTIDLADNRYKDKSRLVAMATHDIETGTKGYVTRLGSVGGLNTTGYSAPILYLGTIGDPTDTPPEDGAYRIQIGAVKDVHATDGSITIDPYINDLTVEVTDTNGFPIAQRSNTILSFDDPTRTFTISASVYPFHYYVEGDKKEQESSQSVVIDDTEGFWWIYLDHNGLQKQYNPTITQKQNIILRYAFVSYFYWNAVDKKIEYDITDERHGISMAPYTHMYLHLTRGSQFVTGYALGNIIADASGALDTHAQYSVEAGTFFDEDLAHNNAFINVGDTIDVATFDGAGLIRVKTQTNFGVLNAPAGRLYYNEWTGATWQLTEVGNGNFVLYHVFGMNGVNKNTIVVMGQNEYLTKAQAREAASTEISTIQQGFEVEEGIPVATVIYETKNTFTNAVKARIVSTDAGEDYIDWRTTELAQGAAPANHGNLTGLTQDDHFQYALLSGRTGDVLLIDTLNEFTLDAGVIVESVTLKDGGITLGTGATVNTIETVLTDDDTHLPTSGAVYDAILANVVSLGTDNQIPHMNPGGTDFDYDPNFTWGGKVLTAYDGTSNILIGYGISTSISGVHNTILSFYSSTSSITSGGYNVFLGSGAGQFHNGSQNVFIGYNSAGYTSVGGDYNVHIGRNTGYQNNGSSNVFLGFYAGYRDTATSNTLYIDNQLRSSLAVQQTDSLIYGVFSGTRNLQKLYFNASVYTPRIAKKHQTLTSSTSISMNVRDGSNAKVTLAHNATLTLSNLEDGDEGNIIVTQDVTGTRTLAISPTPYVIDDGAGVITLTSAGGSIDILSYTYDGSRLFITYGPNYTNT